MAGLAMSTDTLVYLLLAPLPVIGVLLLWLAWQMWRPTPVIVPGWASGSIIGIWLLPLALALVWNGYRTLRPLIQQGAEGALVQLIALAALPLLLLIYPIGLANRINLFNVTNRAVTESLRAALKAAGLSYTMAEPGGVGGMLQSLRGGQHSVFVIDGGEARITVSVQPRLARGSVQFTNRGDLPNATALMADFRQRLSQRRDQPASRQAFILVIAGALSIGYPLWAFASLLLARLG